MPLCLFINDPHTNLKDSNRLLGPKMNFPYRFTLPDIGATYMLRSIICSTRREGVHYKTVATIRGTTGYFIAEIDNMQSTMRILIDQPFFTAAAAAAALYRSVTHPVILVYQKQFGLYIDLNDDADAEVLELDAKRYIMEWAPCFDITCNMLFRHMYIYIIYQHLLYAINRHADQ